MGSKKRVQRHTARQMTTLSGISPKDRNPPDCYSMRQRLFAYGRRSPNVGNADTRLLVDVTEAWLQCLLKAGERADAIDVSCYVHPQIPADAAPTQGA